MLKEKARLNNPARGYVPNGKVESFIKIVGEGTFVSVISAGNGVGKTAAGANIVANICFGPQNKYFDYPVFRAFPYLKQGRIVSNTKTVKETIVGGQKELQRWLPRGRYRAYKAGETYLSHFATDTGFEFDVMTYEQDVEEFESKTLGWVWFDEPPPLAIYKATVARMRRGGIIIITQTPLINASWMYDQIITKQAKGQREVITADVEDNCVQHGVRGILEHANIEKIIAEYDEEELEARIHGRFQHLVGLVFKKFNRKIHVVRPFFVNPRDYVVTEALDPHPRNPDAVMWLATDRKGNKFVVNELYVKATTPELAERIKKVRQEYRILREICDPSAFVQDKHEADPEKSTLASKLLKYGLEYEPASKNRVAANRRIKDAIDFEMKGEDLLVAPELYVFDTCQRTIYEFEHWKWAEWSGKASERKNPREQPEDKDDHMMENLGRLLLLETGFSPMQRQMSTPTVVHTKKDFDPYA